MKASFGLRAAIDAMLDGQSLGALARVAAQQSDFYRARAPHEYRAPVVDSEQAALAYLAWRLPATHGAVWEALSATARCLPEHAPTSLLDLGAGPGTGMWAACDVWPSLGRLVAVEQSPAFIEVGRALAQGGSTALQAARWIHRSATQPVDEDAPHDLVTVAYLLGELPEADRTALLRNAWHVASGVLVVVEPGTTAGFELIVTARAELVAAGGTVIAPCPHSEQCPMDRPDWCHFSARVQRSRTHRTVKQGNLGYEDERYSYVAVARTERTATGDRVIHTPHVSRAEIRLDLCTRTGIEQIAVPRRDKAAYKRARKSRWGDLFDH